MSDDLIEKVARALKADLDLPFGIMPEVFESAARAALAAIEASGTHKVVPTTLTFEMMREAEAAYGGGYVDQDMWTAMLSARPPLPETEGKG